MLRLAHIGIRWPRATLVAWLVAVAALAAIGLGVEDRLSPSVTIVPGTQSSQATDLAEERFGPSTLVPVLLEGPADVLDIQGPALVRALSARSDTRVMSAWSTGSAGTSLRPRPDAAMIVASVARPEDEMVTEVQPQIEELVRRETGGAVTATVTGQPAIDRALKDEALDGARAAELIGIGILFVVLIVALGSVLAAAVVAAMGVGTVLAAFGVMAILGRFFPVDPVAVTLGSLAGLALGTGYALMMVRRFREEESALLGRAGAMRAASAAVATAGRATLVGGTAVIIALALAMLLSSITFQFSIGVGVMACAALGIGAAVAVLPAVLVLAGHRLDAWSAGPPALLARPWARLVAAGDRVVRRPLLAGALGTAALLAAAIPLLGLTTGPPDITMLPSSSPARQSFERVASVMGPGWATPYTVLLVSDDRPLTSATELRKIAGLQKDLAGDARVDSVLGPAAFVSQTEALAKLPEGLDQSARVAKSSKRDLQTLQDGLGRAGSGAGQLREGLKSAADGAGQLEGGSSKAGSGAGQLRDGLDAARSGAARISDGLDAALRGAMELRDGAAKALSGSEQLRSGLSRAESPLTAGVPALKRMARDAATVNQAVTAGRAGAQAAAAAIAEAAADVRALPEGPARTAALARLDAAKKAADDLGASFGSVAAQAVSVQGVSALFADQTSQLASGVKQLLDGSIALAAGIERLQRGNADLANGLKQLDAGGGDLAAGLGKLETGAGQLEDGLSQLTTGADRLGTGLAGGVAPAGELGAGLGTMEAAVAKARSEIPSTADLERLKQDSPGLFDSGYFVLAAIEGAPEADRDAASFAVNLGAGGNAAQIVVASRAAANDESTMALGKTVRDKTRAFAEAGDLQWGVAGPAAGMADFNDYGRGRIALVVAAIAVAVALLLMVALRAVLVAIVVVLLDLLATAATFGVLAVLFGGDEPLLGGPGYLDPMSIIGIFAVVFGLAGIYETLLLFRARERFVATGDVREAVRSGLRASAWPATGAAVAMVAVAIPFVAADLLSVRQFGVGLAVAVLIDGLLVRPVLLPAALTALGPSAWWPTTGASGRRGTRFGRTEPSEVTAPTVAGRT